MNSLSIFNPSFTDSILDAFDKSFNSNVGFFTPMKNACTNSPRVDIRELDSSYIIEADLPGFSEKDIDISLKDRTITLSSINEEKNEEKKADYIIRERNMQKFVRRFSLPEDIEAENVTAEFENGVLTVSIPRKAETQPRQISINKK